NEAISLLLNSRESLRIGDRVQAFNHLCTQGRYREALEFAHDCLQKEEGDGFSLELRLAEVQFDLGKADQARSTLARLAAQVQVDKDSGLVKDLSRIAAVEKSQGREETARRLAAEALAKLADSTRADEVLEHLFPERSTLAD